MRYIILVRIRNKFINFFGGAHLKKKKKRYVLSSSVCYTLLYSAILYSLQTQYASDTHVLRP